MILNFLYFIGFRAACAVTGTRKQQEILVVSPKAAIHH
jgi:hypothetical protein